MEKVDVVLLYEHVARELDVLCAVKWLLVNQYGLRVEIIHQPYGVPSALQKFWPSVVAVPFCYFNFQRDYPCLFDWFPATFVNLAWEELFYSGNQKAKLPRGRFETQHILHQAWGEFFADLLQQQGVPRRNIFLNGHPAYKLFDPPYRAYFATRNELASRYGLDTHKRWIFFPENYNWAFYQNWRLDEFQQAGGLERAHLDAMVRFTRESFTQVMRWCHALALSNDVELIIRPRPLTPLDDFRAAMLQVVPDLPPAIHITKAESVREWILASEVVVSSYSTSLIEAGVAGKPAFMAEPCPLPEVLMVDWQQSVPRLRTLAEFEAACRSATTSTHHNQVGLWARTTMLSRGDPIANLARFLADVHLGRVARPPRPGYGSLTFKKERAWVPDWIWFQQQRRAGYEQRRAQPQDISPFYEMDRFQPHEIEARVQRWGQFLGSDTMPDHSAARGLQ